MIAAGWRRAIGGLLAAIGTVAILGSLFEANARDWWAARVARLDLQSRIDRIVPWPEVPPVPCPWSRHTDARGRKPLVLLVLGQSNAGNHGGEAEALGARPQPSVTVSDGSKCWRVADPLPGGTGSHQSIWGRLEEALQAQGAPREVVLMLLAVDSSSMAEWTQAGGALNLRLQGLLQAARGLPVDFVVWQQGESDARARTDAAAYASGWQTLLDLINGAGVNAPVMAALSTRCRNANGEAVRQILSASAAAGGRVLLGPDTDSLSGSLRERDCHFTLQGLDAAARMWAQALVVRLK